ncbi:putative gmc oxidoreductase [Diplodia seriata]|uniref:Putative gmc oxidoreductase n=1 Tax=Diplodia seriata TaxID=420778 RepID=A0A0G2EPZ0_9PEZI|nr:putative gmc oxidoreductase [Diplodia seriata]
MRSTALLLSAAGALAANTTTTYDYIVVGGGTAGIVAATRFAETGALVLLLERGAASAYSTGNNATLPWNNAVTPYDVPAYGYVVRGMVPAAASCADTASNAGCVLGGGGSVNAELFVPPHAADFAAWPRGWRWEDGGVYVRPPWNVQDAVRSGPVRTYLPDAQALPNFTLQLHAKVLRVVRTGGTATGVEIEQADGTREVINLTSASTGKVVLAAGALSTPRLLFNSGIGPAAQIGLVANGTDDIALPPRRDWIDLPVGEGVQDHPIFYINLNLTSSSPSNTTNTTGNAPLPFFDPEHPSPADVRLYNTAGAGPLAQGPQRLNFWTSRTTSNSSSSEQRSFQGTVTLASPTTISVKIYLTRGLTSRGILGLNATSPHRTIFTTPPWLADAADRDSVVAFLDEMLSLVRTDASWTPVDWVSGAEIVTVCGLWFPFQDLWWSSYL